MNNKNNSLAVICDCLRSSAAVCLLLFATVSCSLSDKTVVTPPVDDADPTAGELPPAEAQPVPEEVDSGPVVEQPDPAVAPEEEPAPAPEPSGTEPAPSPRGDVVWIQQRLRELGYYSGPVDGRVGAATRDAIRAYQADQQLPQDGAATPALQDFMWRNGG